MTPATTTSCQCGRPIGDNASACTHCGARLTKALGDVPWLHAQLQITLTRQDHVTRIGPVVTTRLEPAGDDLGALTARPGPLPFDYRAAEAGANLRLHLAKLATQIAKARGIPITAPRPTTPAGLATWITGHVDWIRHRPDAADEIDACCHAVQLLRTVIDTAAPRVYAGPCGDDSAAWKVAAIALTAITGHAQPEFCPGELYATEGAPTIECDICGLVYEVAERRAWLIEAAEDRLATLAVISNFLADDAHPVKQVRNILDSAERRGRLVPRGELLVPAGDGSEPRVKATYRIGEARELLVQADARERERRARQAG